MSAQSDMSENTSLRERLLRRAAGEYELGQRVKDRKPLMAARHKMLADLFSEAAVALSTPPADIAAAEAAAARRVAEGWNADAIAEGFGGGSVKGREIIEAMDAAMIAATEGANG